MYGVDFVFYDVVCIDGVVLVVGEYEVDGV